MTEPEFATAKKLWQEHEDTALYLLSQKLPNSIFSKYWRKSMVAKIWLAIHVEFTQKSMLMHSSLHSDFMALRYKKGADLRMEFDQVRMKYEQLLSTGITISDDDYRTLIINFVPLEISLFIAQISAGMRALSLMHMTTSPTPNSETDDTSLNPKLKLDPEMLIGMAVEEWECRQGHKKSNKQKEGQTSMDGAFATILSEKLGSRTGGHAWCGHGPRQPVGECWNCGGKGH